MKHWLGGCIYAFLLRTAFAETHREYLPTWSSSFYRPRDVDLKHIGLVNVETVFFATHSGVSTLHDGLLTPAVEVRDAELTAFHMCHHRSSFFYETLAKDGGVLTIYEYSLLAKESVKVAIFQETVAAKALACVDHLLLRASQANLVAVSLTPGAPKSMLQKFKDEDHFTSMAVAFPADSVQHAEVYAVVPRNRSVVKLRLHQDSVDLHLSDIQELLPAGDGADGSVEQASVLDPLHVAWLHGKLLVADRCALRQVSDGYVHSLLGAECSENETLQPAPWASKISTPLGLAAESEATAGQTAMLLTAHQVIQVSEEEGCAESSRDSCLKAGCGWAEGDASHMHCFSCKLLQSWADAQRPTVDPCVLEAKLQPGATRYDLEACGCKPPAPPKYEGGDSLWGIVRLVLFFGTLGIAIAWFRQRQRQRRDEEMYVPAPNVQFHTFNDNGYVRYDEYDEAYS